MEYLEKESPRKKVDWTSDGKFIHINNVPALKKLSDLQYPAEGFAEYAKGGTVPVGHPFNTIGPDQITHPYINNPFAAMKNDLADAYPILNRFVGCPGGNRVICAEVSRQVLELIVHLNDSHKWPREMIADWVDSLG